jgi:hypothetical protein
MADRRAARLQGRSKRLPARRGRCPSRKDYDAAGALIGTAAREGIEAALAGRAYTRDEKALAAARATVARYEATHGVPEAAQGALEWLTKLLVGPGGLHEPRWRRDGWSVDGWSGTRADNDRPWDD